MAAAPPTDAELFARDGFLLCPDVVVPPHILSAAIDGMAALRQGTDDEGEPLQPQEAGIINTATGAGDATTLCKLELPQLGSRSIRALVSLESIGERVAAATGADWVQCWWTQLLNKPPSGGRAGGTNIGYHQDRNYWQNSWEEGSELLTAWVALSDVASDCGPMKFVRGSNRWGLLEDVGFFHEAGDEGTLTLEQQIERCVVAAGGGAAWEEVDAVFPAGVMSLHDNYTLHGSGPNYSTADRRSLAIHVRTNRSTPKGDGGLTAFLRDTSVNPVIFGKEAFAIQHGHGVYAGPVSVTPVVGAAKL